MLLGLGAIAPVQAVWGNVDDRHMPGLSAQVAPDRLAGCRILVTHGHELGLADAARLWRSATTPT